jgi:predicted ATPase
MERLQIRNFLNIKEADIDVGKINLIIGPQASGKSIIAKLLYFFHNFLSNTYINPINQTNTQIKKGGLHEFIQYFPKYAWREQEFSIIFLADDIEVSITHKKNKNGEVKTSLDYSKILVNLHRKLNLNKKKKSIDEMKNDMISEYVSNKDYIAKTEFADSFRETIFIPAGRSFFANLQKNVFSFLASKIVIDPFIKFFGSYYEMAKHADNSLYLKASFEEKVMVNKITNLIEQILIGKYKHENEQDWIIFEGKKINLANASSGQQEALPMLITISFSSLLQYLFFVIEEPEAHLFPISQKHIISLIALIYNKKAHNFVLTTHSPYILTAINNAIMASEAAKKAGKEAVNKIMDLDYSIKYEDVRAYTIRDGRVESIMDEESRLIGASVIDSVSDEFDNVFDSLINLQMEQ